MQAAIEQFARLGGFAALHQRDQKRVFDHFALRMAAANPHHLGGNRLQYPHTGRKILLGESPRRTTDVRHDRTRRQPSARAPDVKIGGTRFQSRPVSGHRRQHGHVDVNE